MASPLGKLPLVDIDDDSVMEVPKYFSAMGVGRQESPLKRRLADADSMDSSPSSRSARNVEVEANVMKQEVRSLLVGHKNLKTELARVIETQVTS